MNQRLAVLERAIEAVLGDLEFELVQLKLFPRGGGVCVQVLIDHTPGDSAVTVGDCVRVARALQTGLRSDGLLDDRHALEVSSPGINRPLTRPAHYRRFCGEQSVVRLRVPREGRRTYTGIIDAAGENAVVLSVDGGQVEIPYGEIQDAHVKADPWKSKGKR